MNSAQWTASPGSGEIRCCCCCCMIQLCTNKLNPDQTPDMSCDQPIYTIAKKTSMEIS